MTALGSLRHGSWSRRSNAASRCWCHGLVTTNGVTNLRDQQGLRNPSISQKHQHLFLLCESLKEAGGKLCFRKLCFRKPLVILMEMNEEGLANWVRNTTCSSSKV